MTHRSQPGGLLVTELTDVGRYRDNNEDFLGQAIAPDGSRLFAVADGMGGFEAGEVASESAVAGAISLWEMDADQSLRWRLSQATTAANETVVSQAVANGHIGNMGTTLVLLGVQGRQAMVAHVGDSRCYLLRDGQLVRLTRDHTEAELLVDEGVIPAEAADHHELSHVLTACLGLERAVEPELSDAFELRERDTLLLCSDGLCGVLDDPLLRDILSYYPLDEAARLMVETANLAGGPDNITLQIVRYGTDPGPLETAPDDFRLPQEIPVWPARIGCLLLLAVLAALMFWVFTALG